MGVAALTVVAVALIVMVVSVLSGARLGSGYFMLSAGLGIIGAVLAMPLLLGGDRAGRPRSRPPR